MKNCAGKRLLLLGGSHPYYKVAKAAKKYGIQVAVVDQNASEEVLSISDDYLKCSLLDVDTISDWCLKNPVDGVLNFCIDFAQKTYLDICERFQLPCLYTKKQVSALSDKSTFKNLLHECGLEIIKTYSEQDIYSDFVHFPVIVKPSEASGSRGSKTCYNKTEAIKAIDNAKKESRNGEIIIEEFIEDGSEFQITFFVQDGHVCVIRTADSYEGEKQYGLERVVSCAVSPSVFTEEYFLQTHKMVLEFVRRLGLRYGPFFMQGFYHHGSFKFFDPGCRFPGVNFDSVFISEYGVDLAELMVEFSLFGTMSSFSVPENMYQLNGKTAAVIFPFIKKGQIASVSGLEWLENNKSIFSVSKRHCIGDIIGQTLDVNQRFGEIDLIGDNIGKIKQLINNINSKLHVYDLSGSEMTYAHFNTERIQNN